ncbi:MAG: membrane protein insertase YidC [Legionellales bacterium]|nr:membrane protein insertase YidC [Legionellales bacterium]
MDYKRLFLYIALTLVLLQLYTAWQMDYGQPKTIPVSTTSPTNTDSAIPSIPDRLNHTQSSSNPVALKESIPENRLIQIKTDVLHVSIDLKGGNLVGSQLLNYPKTLKNKNDPFVLLNNTPESYYVAQSGLIGKMGPDSEQGQIIFKSSQTHYQLNADQDTLTVNLTWQGDNGLAITKSYIFKRGQYLIDVQYQIHNLNSSPWEGFFYTQLSRTPQASTHTGFLSHHLTFTGAAISSPEDLFQKISFDEMNKSNLDTTTKGGWAAMIQHYFLSAWIPPQDQNHHYYSKVNNNIYTIGMLSPAITVNPNQQKTISAQFYTGPEVTSVLKQIAPGLDLTVDYGKLWFISIAIFWLMKHIYDVIGNWGFAIIFVTLLIKLAFYKLSATSYKSMAKMRRLQPQIKTLKDRCGTDKQKFSKSLMELYKREKVNPLGGCLPIIVQIPVFLGLYWVLIESVELRQAPFILWIHDLSAFDPYYILPLLMALSMFLQQKMSPTPPDPTQAKVMMLMPVMFGFLFAAFPAGLVLYWLVNNILSILQQWYVTRQVERDGALSKK